MNTPELIKKLMELSKMNQSQLAKALGKPSTRISEWSTGVRPIKFDEAISFCNKLGIYPGNLFEKDDSIEQICEEISILSQQLQSKITHRGNQFSN